jgi:hypothetical protein
MQMGFFLFLLLLAGIWFAFTLPESMQKAKKRNERTVDIRIIADEYLKENNFKTTRYFISQDYSNGIYYDGTNKKICVVNIYNALNTQAKLSRDNFIFKFISSTDILESEIIQDDVSVTKTSRGGQLAGALIGGALAGGVGAIIGGVTSSKTTSEKIKKVELRILVNDNKKPIRKVTFVNFPTPKPKDDPELKNP